MMFHQKWCFSVFELFKSWSTRNDVSLKMMFLSFRALQKLEHTEMMFSLKLEKQFSTKIQISVRSYEMWSRFDARSQGCKTVWEHQIEQRDFSMSTWSVVAANRNAQFCRSSKLHFERKSVQKRVSRLHPPWHSYTQHRSRISNLFAFVWLYFGTKHWSPFSCKLEKTGFAFEKENCLKVAFFDLLPSIRLYSRQVTPVRPFGLVCDLYVTKHKNAIFSETSCFHFFERRNLPNYELNKHRFLVSVTHTGEVRAWAVRNSPEMMFHQKWCFSVFELFDF